jgi:hypothetical protein
LIDGIRKKVSDRGVHQSLHAAARRQQLSAINIAKVEELTKQKRMVGRLACVSRNAPKPKSRSIAMRESRWSWPNRIARKNSKRTRRPGRFSSPAALLPEDHDRLGQRRKQEERVLRRLDKLIAACESGRRFWHEKYVLADYAFQLITVTAGVLIALFIDASSTEQNR